MDARTAQRIHQSVDQADLVLIGASNGLDMAEGLNVFSPDAHFVRTYGDLAAQTGARSILEGMALTQGDPARAWAWVARFVRAEHLDYQPGPVLRPLRAITRGKDCFVITCNVDGRFERAGFDPAFVLETEGSAQQARCPHGCPGAQRSITDVAARLNASIAGGRVDEALLPRCPACGAALVSGIDERRLARRDAACDERLRALSGLLDAHRDDNVVVLELGVGLRNGAIKRMLRSAVAGMARLTYVVCNYNQAVVPQGLEDACVVVEGDMAQAFGLIADARTAQSALE